MSEAKILNRVMAIITVVVALWFANAARSTLQTSLDVENHPDVVHVQNERGQ